MDAIARRRLELTLKTTLKLPLDRIHAILKSETNEWRVDGTRNDMHGCVAVPDADDHKICIYVPGAHDVLLLKTVLRVEDCDLSAWCASPPAHREPPANMPAYQMGVVG